MSGCVCKVILLFITLFYSVIAAIKIQTLMLLLRIIIWCISLIHPVHLVPSVSSSFNSMVVTLCAVALAMGTNSKHGHKSSTHGKQHSVFSKQGST